MKYFAKNSIQNLAKDILRLFGVQTIIPNKLAQKVPKKIGLDDPATIRCDLFVTRPKLCVVVSKDSPIIKFAYSGGKGYRIFHIAKHKDLLRFFRFLQRIVDGGKEVVMSLGLEGKILRLSNHSPTRARKTYGKHYKASRLRLRMHHKERGKVQKEETRLGLERLFRQGKIDEAYYKEKLQNLVHDA